jgi:hypothetical protein
MKFIKESILICLVLAFLLLAGCTAPNNGTPSGENGQLLGSAVNSADYSVSEASSQNGDNLSDLGNLNDSSGLNEEDLQ